MWSSFGVCPIKWPSVYRRLKNFLISLLRSFKEPVDMRNGTLKNIREQRAWEEVRERLHKENIIKANWNSLCKNV